MTTTAAIPPPEEINFDDCKPLGEFARSLPQRPSWQTLYRWCVTGRLNRHTRRMVKLRFVYLTSGMATSRAMYQEFLQKLNEW